SLYKQGRTDEVVAGCNLILQMDPSFDPARKLLEKTRNPKLPIDVDTLLPASASDALVEARAAMASRDFQRVVNITTEILTNDLMNDEARVLGDEAREKIEAGPFVEQFAKKCEQHIAVGTTAAARQDLEKAKSLDPGHPLVRKIEQMITSSPAAPPAAAAPPPAATPAPSGFSFDAQPSFVVDTKPAPPAGRAAAQATDFGFTFEEEKPAAAPPSSEGGFANFSFGEPAAPAPPPPPAAAPASGGFSFDTPSAPSSGAFSFDSASAAPAKPAGDFDFSTASIETSADDKKKIDQYVADGDRAFDAGKYQQAIDLWSRIFLIDVTNEQASERIERAKAKRREIEQKVEAVEGSYEAPVALPEPAAAAAKKAAAGKPVAKTPAKKSSSMMPIAAVIAVFVLAAGGWFAWSKLSHKSSVDPAASKAAFTPAAASAKRGEYDQAIAILQEIKPEDPEHDHAVLMIADLERKKSQGAALIDGKPAEQYFQDELAAGRAAFDAHDYDGAKRAFEGAARVHPLPADVKSIYDTASL